VSEDMILEVLAGEHKGPEITIPAGGAVWGRGSDCDISPDEGTVSQQHCRIVREKTEWVIEDLDSGGDVIVNGQKTSSSPLKHRDELRLCNLSLKAITVPLPILTPQLTLRRSNQCLLAQSARRTRFHGKIGHSE